MSTHITLQTHAANYLSERRRLGFALRSPGYSVTSFARYVDALNLQEPLTVEIMADWARRDTGNSDKPATWARRLKNLSSFTALLPNREGHAMTRFNVTQRLNIAVARAAKVHSSLLNRSISPHSIRHTTAMHLLQSGVDFSVIALWLGHESTNTTHRYVEADLTMKEKALARLQEPDTKMDRYHPSDDALIQFLQSL